MVKIWRRRDCLMSLSFTDPTFSNPNTCLRFVSELTRCDSRQRCQHFQGWRETEVCRSLKIKNYEGRSPSEKSDRCQCAVKGFILGLHFENSWWCLHPVAYRSLPPAGARESLPSGGKARKLKLLVIYVVALWNNLRFFFDFTGKMNVAFNICKTYKSKFNYSWQWKTNAMYRMYIWLSPNHLMWKTKRWLNGPTYGLLAQI